GDSVAVSGRVVDPEGKPVAGAKVFFARGILAHRDPPPPPPPAVTSAADGRFRLRVSRTGYPEEYMKAQWMRGAVVALGKGFGFGWAGADSAEKLTDVTVRLGKDVPIEGRVLDLQGQPVAGVRVSPRLVRFQETGGGLQDFVEALKAQPDNARWPWMMLD